MLAKPEDFHKIHQELNSFDKHIKFTSDEFTGLTDIHFLDITITPQGTSVYRKPYHTVLFTHFLSFQLWATKISWAWALVTRARKICSSKSSLDKEITKIRQFLSWNGFSKFVANKLITKFMTPKPVNSDETTERPSKIFARIPFIGKQGEFLVRKSLKRVNRLLNVPVNFIILYDNVKTSTFTSMKDYINKDLKSMVVYKYTCPGCSSRYIGKTERCLIKRITEYSNNANSEVFRHIQECEQFDFIMNLQCLSLNEPLPQPILSQVILNSTNIIDKANHWTPLLFKEAFAIQNLKPELNHGLKATKPLQLFS